MYMNDITILFGFYDTGNSYTISLWLGFAVFCIAAFTDFLDGQIARKHNLVTTFGKFADPLADKMLTITALIVVSQIWNVHLSAVILIICRELAVDGLRLAVAGQDIVVPANIWGKTKTAVTMVAIVALLLIAALRSSIDNFVISFDSGVIAANCLIWFCVVLTWVSGFTYFKTLWKYIDMK
jgi:CDP-diacylglycerol--glycerol-3-phosphate 3-phosphatidyltransferase